MTRVTRDHIRGRNVKGQGHHADYCRHRKSAISLESECLRTSNLVYGWSRPMLIHARRVTSPTCAFSSNLKALAGCSRHHLQWAWAFCRPHYCRTTYQNRNRYYSASRFRETVVQYMLKRSSFTFYMLHKQSRELLAQIYINFYTEMTLDLC